jgi:hypothetical protein
VRRAGEASYLATPADRCGRVWVSMDAHQIAYHGRVRRDQSQEGRAGNHGRALRGYRLDLVADVQTGQIVTFRLVRGGATGAPLGPTLARHVRRVLGRRLAGVVADRGFTSRASLAAMCSVGSPFILGFGRGPEVKARLDALSRPQLVALRDGGAIRLGDCPWDGRLRLFAVAARSPTDDRGPWVSVRSLRSDGPHHLATLYRKRGRVERTIDGLRNAHDVDHLVRYRLAADRVAVGSRLLARNLAIGQQLAEASGDVVVVREPLRFRVQHVNGLGVFTRERRTVHLRPLRASAGPQHLRLSWARRVVRIAA